MNREQFEAAYRAAFPSHGFNTSNLFVAHDGLYGHAHVQVAWKMWQAGAAAERERKDEKPVCRHVNTQPMWDHMACLDCGSVRPDGNKTGRPNKGWFRSMDSFRNWDRSAP